VAAGAALSDVGNRPDVEDAEALGGLVGAMQLAERQPLGEVEKGAGDGGDRDALFLRAVPRVQAAYAVDDDAGA
jgi:hypothetical protein